LFIGVLHTNFGNRRAAITGMWVLSCIALYVCCMTVVSVTAAFAQLVSFSCQSLGGRCARRRCLSYSPGGATSESRRQNGTAPTSTLFNVCIKHATNFVMQTKQVSKIIRQKAASPPRLLSLLVAAYMQSCSTVAAWTLEHSNYLSVGTLQQARTRFLSKLARPVERSRSPSNT